MTKTKIYAWHHAPDAQKTCDERPQNVAVAAVEPVESAKAAAMIEAAHTQMIGSFVVSEALAKYKPEPSAIRAAAEDWAASAGAGSRTVVLANVRVPSPTHSKLVVLPATPDTKTRLRARLRDHTASTTRILASVRRMRWNAARTKIAGLAVMLAVCGWFLGKQVPRFRSEAQSTASAAEGGEAPEQQPNYLQPRAAAPEAHSAAAAAGEAPALARDVQPKAAAAVAAPRSTAEQLSQGEATGQRKAIDALISGNRELAISSYRDLAARHPQQRAFAAAANILAKRRARD